MIKYAYNLTKAFCIFKINYGEEVEEVEGV
jgi:hypothetical protein